MSSQRIQWLHRSLPSARATTATKICATSIEKLRSCQFRCYTEVIDEATEKKNNLIYTQSGMLMKVLTWMLILVKVEI
jgi:hypothetical protein